MTLSTPTRRTLAVLGVALLLVGAGCGSGGDSTATPTMEPGGNGDGGDGDVPPGEVDTLGDAVDPDAAPASFTMSSNTRISDEEGVVVENLTVRAGDGPAVYTKVRRRETVNGTVTITETYTTGNATYVRHTVPDSSDSTYERVPVEEASLPDATALAERFDFEHERTDGGHRFTVDSADQVADGTFEGEVRSVSILVVVSEAGVVTELQYDLVLATDDGVVEYHTERTVSERGSTTVSAPGWLDEARNRTPPV